MSAWSRRFMELKGFDVVFRSPGVKLSDIKDKISEKDYLYQPNEMVFDHCPGKNCWSYRNQRQRYDINFNLRDAGK